MNLVLVVAATPHEAFELKERKIKAFKMKFLESDLLRKSNVSLSWKSIPKFCVAYYMEFVTANV
jgi:hypothetical protein